MPLLVLIRQNGRFYTVRSILLNSAYLHLIIIVLLPVLYQWQSPLQKHLSRTILTGCVSPRCRLQTVRLSTRYLSDFQLFQRLHFQYCDFTHFSFLSFVLFLKICEIVVLQLLFIFYYKYERNYFFKKRKSSTFPLFFFHTKNKRKIQVKENGY